MDGSTVDLQAVINELSTAINRLSLERDAVGEISKLLALQDICLQKY